MHEARKRFSTALIYGTKLCQFLAIELALQVVRPRIQHMASNIYPASATEVSSLLFNMFQ